MILLSSVLPIFLYLVHLPFVTNTRYALPIFPAMHLLAVFALAIAVRALWITPMESTRGARGRR